jgi:hypothetical protein
VSALLSACISAFSVSAFMPARSAALSAVRILRSVLRPILGMAMVILLSGVW